MNKMLRVLCVLPLMLCADVQEGGFTYPLDRTIEKIERMTPDVAEQIKALWIELGVPLQGESREACRENVLQWFADTGNQQKLLQKLREQAKEGGIDTSPEFISMLRALEESLAEWTQTYSDETVLKSPKKHKTLTVSLWASYKPPKKEDINEENVAEHIEELRDHEQALKDEATELLLQFGGEAMAAGVTALGGVEILAAYEGVQASRHLIQGCKKYNEAVRCEHMADDLEEQYFGHDEEPVNKKWWEFWK